MQCYKRVSTKNQIFGETLITKGQTTYISEDYRKGSDTRNYVKIVLEDGTFVGEFLADNVGYYENFNSPKVNDVEYQPKTNQ